MTAKKKTDIPSIDGFDMLEQLGTSSTSSVWKARQVSLDRPVILKVLSKHLSHDPHDIQEFEFEAKVTANLKHHGIVYILDFSKSKRDGSYYFVMEYVSGYSIGALLRKKGKLLELDSILIAISVAEALAYVWDKSNLVHCDIKPDNILVDNDGTVKVADLGLAQAVSTIESEKTGAAEPFIMGTPNYISPEQVRGNVKLDYRTDIYALGMTLYHMVTGVLPFHDSDPSVVMRRQIGETLEHPQKLCPHLSNGVAKLILKMIQKDPAARYQNWQEVLENLMQLLASLLKTHSKDKSVLPILWQSYAAERLKSYKQKTKA